MREIKFRFFSERDSQMGKKGMWEDTHAASEGEGLNELIGSLIRMGMKIMQYTGLKDVNDKEIYEGHIIKHQYEKGVAVVKFGEGYQGEPADGMYPYWGWYVDGWLERYAFDGDDVEVVGNIYENPDMVPQ